MRGHWRRIAAETAAAALVIGPLAIGSAGVAGATTVEAPLVQESFTGTTVASPNSWALPPAPGGAANANSACLVSAAGTQDLYEGALGSCAHSGGVPGLQLTDTGGGEQGGIVYSSSLPTQEGLDATFDSYQWGGTTNPHADGIDFFLAADSTNAPIPSNIGAAGGPLGYTPDARGGIAGVNNGYLGFGLDVFGNNDNRSYDGTGTSSSPYTCSDATGTGIPTANQVDVRGPGNGLDGYCLLASTSQYSGGLSGSLDGGSPPQAVPVEVAINPGSTPVVTTDGLGVPADSWAIALQAVGASAGLVDNDSAGCPSTIDINGSSSDDANGVQCLTGALPTVPSGLYGSGPTLTSGIPDQVTFGWAGSTGANNDFHVVSNVDVSTLNGTPVTWTGSLTDSTGTEQAYTAQTVSYTADATVQGATESQAVTFTESPGSGLTPSGASVPTNGGGTVLCSTTACTVTPPAAGFPIGTQLQVKFNDTADQPTSGTALDNSVEATSNDSVPNTFADDGVNWSPDALEFTKQPTTDQVNQKTDNVQVTAENPTSPDAAFDGTVTLDLNPPATGGAGAQFITTAGTSSTLTAAAVDGVANFPSFGITSPGTGYTLGATASGASPATSTPFDIDQAVVQCTGSTCSTGTITSSDGTTQGSITETGSNGPLTASFGTFPGTLLGCPDGPTADILQFSGTETKIVAYDWLNAYPGPRSFPKIFNLCWAQETPWTAAGGVPATPVLVSGVTYYEGTVPFCVSTRLRGPCEILQWKGLGTTTQHFLLLSAPGEPAVGRG